VDAEKLKLVCLLLVGARKGIRSIKLNPLLGKSRGQPTNPSYRKQIVRLHSWSMV